MLENRIGSQSATKFDSCYFRASSIQRRTLAGCGMTFEHGGRTNGPCNKLAAAVGTDAVQAVTGASQTKSTFKTAYHGTTRMRRQIAVAAFTIRFENQH